jgi:hypothetical protein
MVTFWRFVESGFKYIFNVRRSTFDYFFCPGMDNTREAWKNCHLQERLDYALEKISFENINFSLRRV